MIYSTTQGLYSTTQGLYSTTQGLYFTTQGLYSTTQGLYSTTQGLYFATQGLADPTPPPLSNNYSSTLYTGDPQIGGLLSRFFCINIQYLISEFLGHLYSVRIKEFEKKKKYFYVP